MFRLFSDNITKMHIQEPLLTDKEESRRMTIQMDFVRMAEMIVLIISIIGSVKMFFGLLVKRNVL